MFLMVDNYDSFTYNIVQYFEDEGERVDVVRNTARLDDIDVSRYAGIILSPGPSTPDNSGITPEVISRHGRRPMLGVCLGMQAMVYRFGGVVKSARRIMHGKVDEVTHSGGDLFAGVPEKFNAVRYHSLSAERESLPACFEIKALSSDGEIMAVKHAENYMWGVQFHPESYLTEHGRTIVKNFIGGAYEHCKG
ncbi:MAG TPA: aminodeoxychorismate/anthranilate synthase component II [Spirochaetota bacterium]|nr:aminodeoxychorismate/anthranilate synthase component II [Spirochaetota bacterium]